MIKNLKFKQNMILIYIFGIFIPMVCVCVYFANNIYEMLLQKIYEAEKAELNIRWTSLLDTLSDINSVSRRFYFDDELEKIALYNYDSYLDVINDYYTYENFTIYKSYYPDKIDDFSIYMDNNTITPNYNFCYANEEIKKCTWYSETTKLNGSITWNYKYDFTKRFNYLCLNRLIKTKKGQNVGVLNINVSNQKIKDLLESNNEQNTFLILNDEAVVSSNKKIFSNDIKQLDDEKKVCDILRKNKDNYNYKNIFYNGQYCMMTTLETEQEYENSSFTLVSFYPYNAIYKYVFPKIVECVLIIIAGISVSMLLIWKFSKWFGNKVDTFKIQMEKVSCGDYDIVSEIGGSDEISELYNYLGIMINSIQVLTAEVYREKMQKEQLYSRQKDIEFKMLASQINPHFLYNTLELIRMKARANKEFEIEELVRSLAKIMRRNIEVGSKLVTLASEITIVKYYLNIQQCRFGDRIQYRIESDIDTKMFSILPLVLQPIVENAVVHGLEEKEGEGHIVIKIQKTSYLLLIVEDDGCGISKEELEKIKNNMNIYDDMNRTHIGIANINQRIKLSYGQKYGLEVDSKEKEGTTIKISLPIK